MAAAGEDGVRLLATTLRDVGATCDAAGFSWFEEGSEHFFAYCLEAITGTRLVHGELIAMAVLAMSVAQGNDPDAMWALIRMLGVRGDPVLRFRAPTRYVPF